MKTLLLQSVVFCGSLLASQIHAASPASVPIGEFAPVKKFTLKVKSVTSTQGPIGVFPTRTAPVPAGLPDFHKGQSVTFTIGPKGQLTGPAFSINFLADTGAADIYSQEHISPIAGSPNSYTATVIRNGDKPTSASLTFQKYRLKGTKEVQNFVEYELQ